jgi:hypothetical protein
LEILRKLPDQIYLDDSKDVIETLENLEENYISHLNEKRAFNNPENLKVCYGLTYSIRKLLITID